MRAITELLKRELIIAMGCTEPAAAALAGAKAKSVLKEEPISIHIHASRDMVKNAMGVGIPNSSFHGIQAAVCLGIASGDADNGLSLLAHIDTERQSTAVPYIKIAKLCICTEVPPVYIKVELASRNHSASCEISTEHNHVSLLMLDGEKIIDEQKISDSKHPFTQRNVLPLSIEQIFDYATHIDFRRIAFLLDAARTNMTIAYHSIKQNYGLSVGKTAMEGLPAVPETYSDAIAIGAALSAGAADARMAGCAMPVVINSGSGNQGITCSVPLIVLAGYVKAGEEQLARALAISQLEALSLTSHKDRLSALCGAFTAAIGTSCGMAYLMGGSIKEMEMAVKTMVSNLAGIICDGAKESCALKIHSCVQAAGLSSKLACKGLAPADTSGIVGQDYQDTIGHLERLSKEGMRETDELILNIMLSKQRSEDVM